MKTSDVESAGSLSAEELSVLERIVGLFGDWARNNPDDFRSIVWESLAGDRSRRPDAGDPGASRLAPAGAGTR